MKEGTRAEFSNAALARKALPLMEELFRSESELAEIDELRGNGISERRILIIYPPYGNVSQRIRNAILHEQWLTQWVGSLMVQTFCGALSQSAQARLPGYHTAAGRAYFSPPNQNGPIHKKSELMTDAYARLLDLMQGYIRLISTGEAEAISEDSAETQRWALREWYAVFNALHFHLRHPKLYAILRRLPPEIAQVLTRKQVATHSMRRDRTSTLADWPSQR